MNDRTQTNDNFKTALLAAVVVLIALSLIRR